MSSKEHYKALFISDFNIQNCCDYLNNEKSQPMIYSEVAPYGQVKSILVDPNASCWKQSYDFIIVWTQPEGMIDSFRQVLDNPLPDTDAILDEVDMFSHVLQQAQNHAKFILVPSWAYYPRYNIGGILDMRHETGIANILMQMNIRLAKNLSSTENVYLLNSQSWITQSGKRAYSPKLWYMAKIPFDNVVFNAAARDMKAAVRMIVGDVRKMIIVDLDDTLWGGIVGDVGWENIILGGHDYVGEAFTDFQKNLKALKKRGILLGIVSKNEEETALEAIQKHPEMILKVDDFVGWRINWKDKAQNIVDLVSELNLGLQSVVFIDDSSFERARVRETLPEVFVPDWPTDKTLYSNSLFELRCFDFIKISEEDLRRTELYKTEHMREELKKSLDSVDAWLESLNITVFIEEINNVNLQRTVQLLNKTNQMNLTTRRLTETELLEWLKQGDKKMWTLRVSDKLGDAGLTGILSLEVENQNAKLVDFILSCRVFGRKIENVMLYKAVKYAREHCLNQIYAEFIPTPKNKVCQEFFENSGLSNHGRVFFYDCNNDYKIEDFINIKETRK